MAENRAKKSGLGADIDKKLEQRYDQEEAAGTTAAVQCWINGCLECESEKICDCSQKELHLKLKDGVLLCKLINKLLESEGKDKVPFKPKAAVMFVAYTNIDSYNTGCLKYGLAKEFTVQSADLWEGRKGPFLNVINNIHSLGFLANSKGFSHTYTGQIEKCADY